MVTKRNGYMTLAEHDAQLKAEGKWEEYIARKQQKDEQIRKLEEQSARAQAPIIEDLRAAGVQVRSVWDLVNTSAPYPEALPILLQHLTRPYPDGVREGIARALAVPSAKVGWPVLMQYRDEQQPRTKDGLAVALAGSADDSVIADLIALAGDRALGPSRILLLRALEKSSDPRAHKALMDLGVDPDLYKEIQVIMKRLKKRRNRR